MIKACLQSSGSQGQRPCGRSGKGPKAADAVGPRMAGWTRETWYTRAFTVGPPQAVQQSGLAGGILLLLILELASVMTLAKDGGSSEVASLQSKRSNDTASHNDRGRVANAAVHRRSAAHKNTRK